MKRIILILSISYLFVIDLYSQPCSPSAVSSYDTLGTRQTYNLYYFNGPCLIGSNSDNGMSELVKFIPPSSGKYELEIRAYTYPINYPYSSPLNIYLRQTNGLCDFANYTCLYYDSTFQAYTKYYTINAPVGNVIYDILIAGVDSFASGTVDVIINCARPTNIAAGNITTNSADISYNCNCPNAAYLEYGPAGFVPGTDSTTGGGTLLTGIASPVTLTSLSPYTQYEAYLRINCSGVFSHNQKLLFRTSYDCSAAQAIQCGSYFDYYNLDNGIYGNWQNYDCGPSNNNTIEKIFSFTPSQDGFYSIDFYDMHCNGGDQSSFYYKEASGSCSDSGWTCMGDLTSLTLPPYSLTWGPLDSGITYLLMTDGTYYGSWYQKYFQLNCLSTSVFGLTGASHPGNLIISSNHSSHQFTLVTDAIMNDALITIYTMTGSYVYNTVLSKARTSFYFDAPPGIYLAKVSDGKREWVQKLIVE